jgi:hypothetical protein
VTTITLDTPEAQRALGEVYNMILAWSDEDEAADEVRVREAHGPSAVAETVSGKEMVVSVVLDGEFEKA